MKQIIVIKPKSLSSKDKEKLTKAGNIVIEHEKSFEINYHTSLPNPELVFDNCITCGHRIYMMKDQKEALVKYGAGFYCTGGHYNKYVKPAK